MEGANFYNLTTMITNFINIYGGFDDKKHEGKDFFCFVLFWVNVCNGVTIATNNILIHGGHALHGPPHKL